MYIKTVPSVMDVMYDFAKTPAYSAFWIYFKRWCLGVPAVNLRKNPFDA